jgi:hypothetical protein
MPPKLSARQMFWTGAVLTVIGALLQQYLSWVIYSMWGNDVVQAFVNGPWSFALAAAPWLIALGVLLLACSLIVRNIEAGANSQPKTSWRPVPPKLTALQIAWTGVILVVVGLILTNTVGEAYMSLAWKVDFASNLARDLLIVAQPLSLVILPLGIALLPCSFVVRMLESRTRDREAKSVAHIID